MVSVAEQTLKEVDVVLWLVEPTDFHRKRRAAHCRAAEKGEDVRLF